MNDNEHDWDTTDIEEDSGANEGSIMERTTSGNKDRPIKWKNLSSDDEEEDDASSADEEEEDQ